MKTKSMNTRILSVVALVAFVVCCDAGEDHSEHLLSVMQFYMELKGKVCTKTVTNAQLDKLLACKDLDGIDPEIKQKWEERTKKMDVECGPKGDPDLKQYETQLDLKNSEYKRIMRMFCSDGYQQCRREKAMALMAEHKEDSEHVKKHWDSDKKDKMLTCAKQAFP